MKPKIFRNCENYNNKTCQKTQMIQKELNERIGLESPPNLELDNAVDINRAVVEVSNSYCKDCDDFL